MIRTSRAPTAVSTWYDPLSGMGCSIVLVPRGCPRHDAATEALRAGRVRVEASLPVRVSEPLVGRRPTRGPRLSNGDRHFVYIWIVGDRTAAAAWRNVHRLALVLLRISRALPTSRTTPE